MAQRPPGVVQDPDPDAGAGTRVHRRLQHRGDLHLLPAQEGRLLRPSADPHRPAGGLHPAGGAAVRLRAGYWWPP